MGFHSLNIPRYYYYVKPFIPRRMQLLVRRWVASWKRRRCGHIWPIDRNAGKTPEGWQGWPDGKKFALVLTHDVDTAKGHDKSGQLMELEKVRGFRSSFNFVVNEYRVSDGLRRHLSENGFEVGVHGLMHNRELFASRDTFQRHACLINVYMRTWQAVGFRSPCMYHNLAWFHDLDIAYDASTFDTDPFEPQDDGVGTVFPLYVQGDAPHKGYLELPYTLPQDFTLFILFKERDIGIWKEKLRWVAEQGGMVLLNSHPDYMNFSGSPGFEEYPASFYEEFLEHVTDEYAGQYWHALPREVAAFCAAHRDGLNVEDVRDDLPAHHLESEQGLIDERLIQPVFNKT